MRSQAGPNNNLFSRLIAFLTAIKRRFCVIILSVVSMIILVSCHRDNAFLVRIKVEETAGLNRVIEYVEISLPPLNTSEKDHDVHVYAVSNQEKTPAQIIDPTLENEKYEKRMRIVFPISIAAFETKEYIIKTEPGKRVQTATDLNIRGDKLDLTVDNKYFSAFFKGHIGYKNEKLGSGHLGSISLKEFNNVLLARKDPNLKIHWAPSFSKENLNYRTMAHITSPDSVSLSTKGPYYFSIFRSGRAKGYEKILLKGEYRFFAGLPYITFHSEISFTEGDSLNLLRNDEMTMDSLFTNVVFPRPNGKTVDLALYDQNTIAYLDENPIADNAPWLFFYNKPKSYAFGSIRLNYDNRNVDGGDSPTDQKHTKITVSTNAGRYWNRRLIHSKNTFVPKGSKYSEKNAYIVFKIDKNDPEKRLKYFYERLKNPVSVSYMH